MNSSGCRRRGDAIRRYPALGFLGIAAVLATLLPTTLHVPLSGPTSSAEVAPISGEGDERGALSELNGASSGGLGSGSGTGAANGSGAVAGAKAGQPPQGHVNGKHCVGQPRRQTEDPLAPRCVPFFDGDNGGATTRGVTRDEIIVAVYYAVDNTQKTVAVEDWGVQKDSSGTVLIPMVGEAFASFFNNRYQTYNRDVHFFGITGHAGSNTDGYAPESIRASVLAIKDLVKPFAIVSELSFGNDLVADAASQFGIVTATRDGMTSTFLKSHAPYVYTFRPSIDEEAALTADFVCTKLAGNPPARGNGDVLATRRKFGILVAERAVEPGFAALGNAVQSELKARCNEPAIVRTARNDNNAAQCQQTNQTAMAQFLQDKVTTVIAASSDGLCFTNTNASYSPEWIIPGSFGGVMVDSNGNARNLGPQMNNAMGVSFDLRRSRQQEQTWFLAYQEGCPTCPVAPGNGDFARLYDAESMLMYGVQGAGPKLTPQSFDKGLHAIPAHASPDAYTPAAYFTAGGYSFTHDAVEIWWDKSGTDAASGKPGCYRLPDAGKRRRLGEFPRGESELFQASPPQPCQGDWG